MGWSFCDEEMASIYWSRLEENLETFIEKIVRFEQDCLEFFNQKVDIQKMSKYFELISTLQQIVYPHQPVSFDSSITIEKFYHIPCILPTFRFFDKTTAKKAFFPKGYKFENINHGYVISNLLFVIEQLRRDLNFIFSTGCCIDPPTGPGDLPLLNFLTENSAPNHNHQLFPADFLLHEKDGRLIIPVNLLL